MNIKEAQAKFVLGGEETEIHADAPYTLSEYEQLRRAIWEHFIECDKAFSDGECSLCLILDNWMRRVREERKRAAKLAAKQQETEREFKNKVRSTGLWDAT